VQSGTLDLNGGGSSSAVLQDEAGAMLQFGNGSFSIAANSQLNAAGNLTVTGTLTTDVSAQVSVGGTLTVNGSTMNANASMTVTNLTLNGQNNGSGGGAGLLAGGGTVTVTGSLNWGGFSVMYGSGTTVLAAGATGSLSGWLGRTLQIGGSATIAANTGLNMAWNGAPGTLSVLSGGTLTLQSVGGENDTVLSNSASGNSLQNAGMLVMTGSGARTIAVPLTNTGTIDVQSGTLNLSGGVTNSGTLEADGGNLFVAGNSISGSGLITGGSILQFGGASVSTNVHFEGSSTGTLQLDQSQSYAGTVTGFSLTANTTKLDLSDIGFASGTTTATFAGDSSGGVLTIKDASNHTAHIALQGTDYRSAVWVTLSDGHGGTLVHDPSFISSADGGGNASIGVGAQLEVGANASESILLAGSTGTLQLDQSQSFTGQISGFGAQDQIDLTDIAFDPNTTTLGYSGNGDRIGGTLSVSDGTHAANLALLGSYMASSFAMASDGHGGTSVVDLPALGGVQPLVTSPHA
jgi:hypothetical protein